LANEKLSGRDQLEIKLEQKVIAIAAVVRTGPCTWGGWEITVTPTSPTNRLVYDTVFVKATCASVNMFM
jgi:hypothetical protein